MKKNFKVMTVLASAALLLTACSSDKLEATSQAVNNPASADNSIQFGTYMGRATAATRAGSKGVITDDVLKVAGYGFGVMAFNTGNAAWSASGATTNPNFMYNENIYWDGGDKWIYDNVKYWPNDFNNGAVDREASPNTATGSGEAGSQNKLSFFAYAPYVEIADYSAAGTDVAINTSVNTKYFAPSGAADEGIVAMTYNQKQGDPYLKYILKDATSTNAVDMLWGMRGNTSGYDLANGATEAAIGNYNTDLTKQTVKETVNFLFKHALAKIGGHDAESTTDAGDFKTGLQVILDIDKDGAISGGSKSTKTLVTVDDVLIEDWYTYNKRLDASTTEKSDLMTDGWFNIATGTWSDVAKNLGGGNGVTYTSGTTTTTSVGAMGKLNPEIAEPASSIASTDGSSWTLDGTARGGVVDDTPKDVYSADSDVPAVFMIPAPSGSGNDQSLVVTVTYTVRTFDSHLASISDVGSSTGTWTKVKQKITNRVTIPGGSLDANKYYKLLMHLGLTSVKFSATVADWAEATNSDEDGNGDIDADEKDKDINLPSNTLSVEGVYDQESSMTTVNMTGASAQTITLPYTAGPHIVAALNSSASTTPKIELDAASVTDATVTNFNGVITISFTSANNTASVVDHGTFKLTDDGGHEITVTLKQGVGIIALSATPLLVDATGAGKQTIISASINSTPLTLADADVKDVKEGATDVKASCIIAADGKVTFPDNKTAKRKTYTVTVGQGDAADEKIDIVQKSGAITAERDGSGNVSAAKGTGSAVTITVKDSQDTPETLNLTNTTDYKSSVEVKCGGTNVTGNCTIQKTTTGVKVILPANSTNATKTYNIKVTVNDATTATAVDVTQDAA